MEFNTLLLFLSFISTFSFITFYLDDFKLSDNLIIRYAQILSPLLIIGLFIYIYYNLSELFNIDVSYVSDDKSDTSCTSCDPRNVSLNANIEIGKEAGKEISRGISSLGSQVGLGATVAGVSAAVSKGIASSSLPPLQKAAVIVGSAMAGGAIHVGVSAINRKNNLVNSAASNGKSFESGSKSSSIGDNINKFIDNPIDHSPIKDLILSIEILNKVCLCLTLILFMQILFKFFLDESKIKFDLSSFIGTNLNDKLNYYLVKIIRINKKIGNIYLWFILLVLIISLFFSNTFISELSNNLDDYINIYINKK